MIRPPNQKNPQTAKQWTFLTNHALVLLFVARHPRITARELSYEIGITERAIRTIISDLETAGYLEKTKEGRTLKYDVNHDMPMRHPTQQDVAVGDLLATLGLAASPAGKNPGA